MLPNLTHCLRGIKIEFGSIANSIFSIVVPVQIFWQCGRKVTARRQHWGQGISPASVQKISLRYACGTIATLCVCPSNISQHTAAHRLQLHAGAMALSCIRCPKWVQRCRSIQTNLRGDLQYNGQGAADRRQSGRWPLLAMQVQRTAQRTQTEGPGRAPYPGGTTWPRWAAPVPLISASRTMAHRAQLHSGVCYALHPGREVSAAVQIGAANSFRTARAQLTARKLCGGPALQPGHRDGQRTPTGGPGHPCPRRAPQGRAGRLLSL